MKRRRGDGLHGSRWSKKKKKKQRTVNQHKNSTNSWLLFPHKDAENGYISTSTTTSGFYKSCVKRFFPDLADKKVWNCCYGWLIVSNLDNLCFNLWNPVTSKSINLPQLYLKPNQSIQQAVLFSNNKDEGDDDDDLAPNSMVLLFDDKLPSVVYCRLSQKNWVSVCYRGAGKIKLYNPVVFDGSLYAETTSRGFVAIELVKQTHIVISEYGDLPNVPKISEYHYEYFVESYGELFYIVIKCGKNSEDFLEVEAFKLDRGSMGWNKARRADDRVFFLSERYAFSCRATTGFEGGFIYYFWEHYLFIYNFEENSVSVSFPHVVWNIPDSCCPPIPYTTHISDVRKINSVEAKLQSQVDGKEIREETNNDNNIAVVKKNEGEDDPFGRLPVDLLKIIVGFLNNNVVDYMNFRAISRSCKSAAPRIRWREAPNSLKSAPLLPWLMSSDNHSGIHTFVDSKLGGKYLVKIPEPLLDAKILSSSNGGWLLMHNIALESLSIYHPFTKNIIKLPQLPQAIVLSSSIGFSPRATSKNYVVVAIHAQDEAQVNIFWYGWSRWYEFRFSNDRKKFVTNHNSPVFHDGGFYVLGRDGNLGFFKVLAPHHGYTWKVLDKPQNPCINFTDQSFLLECGGKLLSVFMGPVGEWIEVFVLHENGTAMSWRKVTRLVHWTLYLNRTSSSFSIPAKITRIGGKIFLPNLHNDTNTVVCYCLETGKYHCFGREDDAVLEYHHTRQLLSSGWIEPSWS